MPTDAAAAHTEQHCQYRSSICLNVRAVRRDGKLHRLCEFHRARANQNQWWVDQRKRIRRERARAMEVAAEIYFNDQQSGSSSDTGSDSSAQTMPPNGSGGDDIEMLEMLFDDWYDTLSEEERLKLVFDPSSGACIEAYV